MWYRKLAQKRITAMPASTDVYRSGSTPNTAQHTVASSSTAHAPLARAEEGTPRVPAAGLVVLVVDDDPAVRVATELLLKIEGYRVLTAGSLAEARQRAIEYPDIALLLTDYHLGSAETGLQVIAHLRQRLGPGLKAILITGDPLGVPEPERTRLRPVSKSVDADELLGMMQALLQT